MKRWTSFPLWALLIQTAAMLHAGEFVTNWGGLLTAAADADGDGDLDSVLVDQETGLVSVGILNANGALAFRRPAAAGLPGVTGMAVGRLLSGTQDTLALASPLGNRLQVVDLTQDDLRPMLPVFSMAGPRWLAALPIPGGLSGLDSLALAAAFDGVSLKFTRQLINGGVGGLSTAGAGSILSEAAVWNPVAVSRGGVQRLVLVETNGGSATLRLVEPNGTTLSYVATVTGLSATGQMAHGYFDAAEMDLFWFVPGTTSLEARRLQPGGTAFNGGSSFIFPKPLRQLLRLPDATADRLLTVYDDGQGEVWSYTAAGGFVSIQDVDIPSAAGGLRAALALGAGKLLTMSGPDAGLPTSYRLHEWDGSSYVPTGGGRSAAMGSASDGGGGECVLLFRRAVFDGVSPPAGNGLGGSVVVCVHAAADAAGDRGSGDV